MRVLHSEAGTRAMREKRRQWGMKNGSKCMVCVLVLRCSSACILSRSSKISILGKSILKFAKGFLFQRNSRFSVENVQAGSVRLDARLVCHHSGSVQPGWHDQTELPRQAGPRRCSAARVQEHSAQLVRNPACHCARALRACVHVLPTSKEAGV